MGRKRKASRQELEVLSFMLTRPDSDFYGLEIVRATGIKPGSLYPILRRLEERKWVASDWENVRPQDAGRPRRRYYRLEPVGAAAARAALKEFAGPLLRFGWQA